MKILKFKTNIKNQECIDKVDPFLRKEEFIRNWKVDIESPENILSVSGEQITADIVTKVVNKAGFQAEIIRVLAVGGHDL